MNLRSTFAAILLLACSALSSAFADEPPTAADIRLLDAAERGDLKEIRAALAAGANANATHQNGKTVLEVVSYEGHIYDKARTVEEIDARLKGVRLLVEKGAKVDVNREGYFPLHLVLNAFYEGRYVLAQFLLEHRGDPKALDLETVMRKPRFPIKNPDAVRRTLFETALARTDRKLRYPPLAPAVVSDDGVYFTRRLLEVGYDPNQRYYTGMTPLLVAIEQDRAEIVALLLKYKANVQQTYQKPPGLAYTVLKTDLEDKTPMRLAREKNRKTIIALLEKAGATTTPAASNDKTPSGPTPRPLSLRFRGVFPHILGNDRVGVVFEVINPSTTPLAVFGYGAGSREKNISPFYEVDMEIEGRGLPNRTMRCGTGAGPIVIAPRQTRAFTATLVREGWDHVRVGLTWFSTDPRAKSGVVWSEQFTPKDIEPRIK